MGVEHGGWPSSFEVLPDAIEKGINVVRAIGRFLRPLPESGYRGDHVRGAAEMLDAHLFKPVEDPYWDSKNEVQLVEE